MIVIRVGEKNLPVLICLVATEQTRYYQLAVKLFFPAIAAKDQVMERLFSFLTHVEHDARLGTVQISLYMALWKKWKDSGCRCDAPLFFFRSELVRVCKISSLNTYHTTLRELHEYGYVRYEPSYNRLVRSSVYFLLKL